MPKINNQFAVSLLSIYSALLQNEIELTKKLNELLKINANHPDYKNILECFREKINNDNRIPNFSISKILFDIYLKTLRSNQTIQSFSGILNINYKCSIKAC